VGVPAGLPATPAATDALVVRGVRKTFGATRALLGIDMAIRRGEVHALVGQNGCGKSTLIKLLAGFHEPDAPTDVLCHGRSFAMGDAAAAHASGLRFVHQDLGVVSVLNTMDNLALGFGYARSRGGPIRWREQQRLAEGALAGLGYQFDVRAPLAHLAPVQQTAVAIARALQGIEPGSSVLVLDEPTAAMPKPEVKRMFGIVRTLRTSRVGAPDSVADAEEAVSAPGAGAPRPARRSFDLRADRLSGVYLALVLAVIFVLWLPHTFATATNVRTVLAGSAITGIIALGATVGLISGAFDISVAANMSVAISLVGWLQSAHHVNALLAVLLTLASGATVGSVNAFVITRLKVEPVIATLGMSSLLVAVTYWIAGGQTIIDGISSRFTGFGTGKLGTVPLPVFYLAGVALLLWYLLGYTPLGRYLYAAGANPAAARLAGLSVRRLQWTALVISGVLSSLAGIVLTMQLGASSFGAGDPYLLPAYAAAFLGATQIKPGRFNVAGTLVALYLLAIGVKGLQLRYPSIPWIADLFQGLALIIAVALGVVARRKRAQSS
jgi:ribose transport system permease protein